MVLATVPRDPTTSGQRGVSLSPTGHSVAVITSQLESPVAGQGLTRTMARYRIGLVDVFLLCSRRDPCVGLGSVGGCKKIFSLLQDDKEAVVKIGMAGLVVHCAILGQCGIRNGQEGGEIFKAVGAPLDADLGDIVISIVPADEYLPRAFGGNGEPGKGILRPDS